MLGEARVDKRFYATFLTTIDPEYSFAGGIRVGAGTKILENFFGDSIMNAGHVEGQKVTLTGPDYGSTDDGPDHINITCVNGVVAEIRLYRSGSYVFSFKALEFANKRLDQMGLSNTY